jgi:hypothetical protein
MGNDKKYGKFDVYILPATGGYRVRPAVTAIDGKRKGADQAPVLDVRNLTGKKVTITFPPPLADPVREVSIDVPAGGKASQPLIKNLDGAYPYRVEVQTTPTVSAMGESDPVIIIDP